MWDFPVFLPEGGPEMKRKRYSEEKIISILKEHEAGASAKELSRRHAIAENTIYRWKAKYGGMEVSEARRLRELQAENSKLKRLLAEAELDKAALKELVQGKW
jgi:putative transposase